MHRDKSLKDKISLGDLMTKIICKIICFLFLAFFAVPVGYVLISSVYNMGNWSLKGYMLLFENNQILSGLKNCVLLTVIGTFYSLILEIPVAYVTSKKEFGWLIFFII
ncbi:MAG: hypothetical protein IKW08_00920 [Roseburia sp.]|nr:hypothetical protein [Roseburia sp.]